MSFLDTIGNTVKSLGGASIAPIGVTWDLATTPFDDKDDDFSTVVDKIGKGAQTALDPLLNDKTLTGFAFTKSMAALATAYRAGVSEPISTLSTMPGHEDASGLLMSWTCL